MNVFVIIVTYNGERWIYNCLSSLRKSTIKLKPIVIDNASTDRTVRIIEEHFPEVSLVKSDTNWGFGKANNIGITKALEQEADFLFLLNQDAYLEPETTQYLLEEWSGTESYGILSPVHLEENGQFLDFNFKSYLQKNPDTHNFVPYNNICPKVYDLPFVNAAAWLVSRKAIERVGGFDPLFPHYGEDEDYVQRLKYHGFKIGVVTTSYIRHCRTQKPVNTLTYNRILIRSLINSKSLRSNSVRNFLKVHLRNLREAIANLFKGDYKQCVTYIMVNARLLSLSVQLFKSVRESKFSIKPFLK
jgi:GT2 family glycosyltransferase